MSNNSAEHRRLEAHRYRQANWKKWGPYLSERAWGTVREDYSSNGAAWGFLTHDQSRSKAYRWNEDGLMGFCDRNQYLCIAVALWNGVDPILKERLFGLTGKEGNHGEDVKEYYFYLDSSPTHSYVKMLYKYPIKPFPYTNLVAVNEKRDFFDMEYELGDTGVFDDDSYWDLFVEYVKDSEEEILIKITAHNRSSKTATLHLLPTVWYRNTWEWGYSDGPMGDVTGKPEIWHVEGAADTTTVECRHAALGTYYIYAEGNAEWLFTDNETNRERLYGAPNVQPYVKDAFHHYVVDGDSSAVNPQKKGTKAAPHYLLSVDGNASAVVRLCLSRGNKDNPFNAFEEVLQQRVQETDEFYRAIQSPSLSNDAKNIQRQAFAGMLISKQLYYYDIEQWLKGDPSMPTPPQERKHGRNNDWEHLVNFDILSMPDKWEYPWYASWDLAFHCIPLVLVDPEFTKRQLTLMTREWYMHPNGELPAYEWNFSDVNPPVHAWATWRVYKIDAKARGKPDLEFLQGIFNKLLLNFTWWVNRKDPEGNNVFQGGFLGMDNISIFDRSKPIPLGGHIDQSDGTAWMGFYCLVMMKIALELAKRTPVWQDMATKFFEHFLRIAGAMTHMGGDEDVIHALWDDDDGFFYDQIHMPDDEIIPLKVRSLVGLLPLLAVETIEAELVHKMPIFERRMDWFLSKRPDLGANMASIYAPGIGKRRLMSILTKERLISVLRYMLDEEEFLSPYGIRSLSKHHQQHPYIFSSNGQTWSINYQPAESQSEMFGGNSNWRGPIWFPINFLLIESLQKFHHYYGDDLKVEFPSRSGNFITLWEVAGELSCRLTKLFLRNDEGKRPIYGDTTLLQENPHWKEYILFNEYFHGDNGAGLGASHQTGWTGLVAKLIQQSGG